MPAIAELSTLYQIPTYCQAAQLLTAQTKSLLTKLSHRAPISQCLKNLHKKPSFTKKLCKSRKIRALQKSKNETHKSKNETHEV